MPLPAMRRLLPELKEPGQVLSEGIRVHLSEETFSYSVGIIEDPGISFRDEASDRRHRIDVFLQRVRHTKGVTFA
jgi:hypothetical protein